MRRHATLDAGLLHVRGEDAVDALAGQSPAAPVQQERASARARRERGARPREVGRDRLRAEASERHLALLAPFAQDPHGPFVQVDIVDVETDELRDPQPRSVEELEERAVAQARGRGCLGRLEQPEDLVDTERARERSRQLGLADARRGIARGDALPQEEPVEGADGRERPGDRRRLVGALVLAVGGCGDRRHERPDRGFVDRVQRRSRHAGEGTRRSGGGRAGTRRACGPRARARR